ncbi:unnamed protein product [Ilex paraguariensis]|uniref:BRCT domain-containing protein n=1 Tax=Ilex paraguariensis TaxID=185542 RepID=A0ABC8RWX8_9AQUA
MGSLGDDDDKMKSIERDSDVEPSDAETQLFDSGGKGEDDLQYLQSTVPFDEFVAFEDVFETQVLDLGGETSELNLGGETQVIHDPDCEENINTQLLDACHNEVAVDSDGEGTDRTEILSETEELSDEDSVKIVGSHPLDQENMPCTALRKQGDDQFKAELNALSNEKHSSGSVHRDFTSVRVASLRACGLAAHSMTSKGTNGFPCSIMSDSQSLKRHTTAHDQTPVGGSLLCVKEVDQAHVLEEYDAEMKGSRNENRCRVGSSTVRKLFAEDMLVATKEPYDGMNKADGEAEFPRLFPSENELAGLSYVNSQEPGELSQANALDFVDKFLKVNIIDFDEEIDFRKSTGGKSKPVSSAKGTQSLAKRANPESTDRERGIFDWDDTREDEGGGEFFRKKKDALFDNGGQMRRSHTHPRKPRFLETKGNNTVEESRGNMENLDKRQKIVDSIHFDSRLVFHDMKGNDKSRKAMDAGFKKNLTKELDERVNVGSKNGMVDTGTNKDVPDMSNIGFDTQMAAEAMEALSFGVVGTGHDFKDANQGAENMQKGPLNEETIDRRNLKRNIAQKRGGFHTRMSTKQSKQTKRTGTKLSEETSISLLKTPKNVRKQSNRKQERSDLKKVNSDVKGQFTTKASESLSKVIVEQRKEEDALRRSGNDKIDRCNVTASSGRKSVEKWCLQEQLGSFMPIAHRTRQCMKGNQSKKAGNASNNFGDEVNNLAGVGALKNKRKRSRADIAASIVLNASDKSNDTNLTSKQSGKLVKLSELEQSDPKLTCTTSAVKLNELDYPRGRRTRQRLSADVGEANKKYNTRLKRLQTDAISTSVDLVVNRKTRSSVYAMPVLPSLNGQSGKRLLRQIIDKGKSSDATFGCNSVDMNENTISEYMVELPTSTYSDGKSNADTTSVTGAEANAMLEASPKEGSKPVCTTPVNCMTPLNAVSPICIGDEYLKKSCRENLSKSSLMKEINSLITIGTESTCVTKYLRRRDVTGVRVLFSQHLDGDMMRQQKKILTRLGGSVASSISDATHFVTDKFVRTRNMLEAIASGKPVVTSLWLESCGQASCFIDERNHILRDSKKEKELGFSMPVSLARACEHPLLQGQRVLITPNTKPGKEILASLVKAVYGVVSPDFFRTTCCFPDAAAPIGNCLRFCKVTVRRRASVPTTRNLESSSPVIQSRSKRSLYAAVWAVERMGRSALKGDKIPDDLLVLSCEEDYSICRPFLEKGAAIYCSELLLNGIVTQKLDYGRHRLFTDHVKRTRSTVWLKDGNQYLPVNRCK